MRRACYSKGAAARAALLLALLQPLGTLPAHGEAECECLWQGSFVDVQQEADFVVAGEVLRQKGNSLDLEVIEALRGPDYLREVRIWMQAKSYRCRPPVDAFAPGTRWVMALTKIHDVPEGGFDPATPNISYGRRDDYILSSCGGYWLNYEGEAVTGNLVDAPRWAREVEMTPVLFELLRAFVQGKTTAAALAEASREDPALGELLLDTKAFLRGDTDLPDH